MPRNRRKARKSQKPVVITIDSDDENEVIDVADNDAEADELAQERDAYKAIFAKKYESTVQDNRGSYIKAEIIKESKTHYRLKSAVAHRYRTAAQKRELNANVQFSDHVSSVAADDLLNGGLISDAIIWPFFQAVASKNEMISVLDSTFSGMDDFADRLRASPNYGNIDRAAFRASRRILWPMFADAHWHLVIMHRVRDGVYQLYCIDSLNTNSEVFMNKATDFLQVLYPNQPVAELVKKRQNIEILRQHNLVDCAASVCFWGMRMAASIGLPASQKGTCDYSAYRYDMAVEVAEFAAKQVDEAPKRKVARRR